VSKFENFRDLLRLFGIQIGSGACGNRATGSHQSRHEVPSWNGEAEKLSSYRFEVSMFAKSIRVNDRYVCGPQLVDDNGKLVGWEKVFNYVLEKLDYTSLNDTGLLAEEFFLKIGRNSGETFEDWAARFEKKEGELLAQLQAIDLDVKEVQRNLFAHGEVTATAGGDFNYAKTYKTLLTRFPAEALAELDGKAKRERALFENDFEEDEGETGGEAEEIYELAEQLLNLADEEEEVEPDDLEADSEVFVQFRQAGRSFKDMLKGVDVDNKIDEFALKVRKVGSGATGGTTNTHNGFILSALDEYVYLLEREGIWAALDIGATRSLGGVESVENLMYEMLVNHDVEFETHDDTCSFTFGDGLQKSSMGTVFGRVYLGPEFRDISLSVMANRVPILLGMDILTDDLKVVVDCGRNWIGLPTLGNKVYYCERLSSKHLAINLSTPQWWREVSLPLFLESCHVNMTERDSVVLDEKPEEPVTGCAGCLAARSLEDLERVHISRRDLEPAPFESTESDAMHDREKTHDISTFEQPEADDDQGFEWDKVGGALGAVRGDTESEYTGGLLDILGDFGGDERFPAVQLFHILHQNASDVKWRLFFATAAAVGATRVGASEDSGRILTCHADASPFDSGLSTGHTTTADADQQSNGITSAVPATRTMPVLRGCGTDSEGMQLQRTTAATTATASDTTELNSSIEVLMLPGDGDREEAGPLKSLNDSDLIAFYQAQIKVMDQIYFEIGEDTVNLTKTKRADLMEVCCPNESLLGKAVEAQHGRVMRCGLFNGYDMGTATGVRRAMHLLRLARPRRLALSPPCTADCPIQNLNQKTENQRKQLSNKIRQARRIQRGCLALYEEAKNIVDCHIELEQPWNSRSWSRSPSIKKMRSEMHETIIHGCAYGLRDERSGLLVKKGWRVCSTDPDFGAKAGRLCCNRPGRGDNHLHRVIEDGPLVAQTAFYPPAMCRAWAKHILKKNVTSQYGKEIYAGLEQIPEEDDVEMSGELEELNPEEDVEMETAEASLKGLGVKTELSKKEISEIEQRLARLHRNLGHPSNQTLYKILKASGVEIPSVLEVLATDGLEWLSPHQTSHIMTLSLDEGSGLTSVAYHGQKGERSGNRSAIEAHWLMGKVERRIQLFKRLMTKMATHDPDCSTQELVTWAVSAINSMDKVGNHSPFEHVLGVTGMAPSNNPFAIIDGDTGETQEQRRLLAHPSYLECEYAERRRHAEQARNRIYQTWEAGDLVHFWRDGKGRENRPGKKGGWHGFARVLVQEKRHIDGRTRVTSVVWIAHGNTLIRCAPEHLRQASETEKMLTELKKQASLGKTMTEILETAKAGTFEDLVEQRRPDLTAYEPPMTTEASRPGPWLNLKLNQANPPKTHRTRRWYRPQPPEKRRKDNNDMGESELWVDLQKDNLDILLGADEHQTVYFEYIKSEGADRSADKRMMEAVLNSSVANQRRKDKLELPLSKMNASERAEFEVAISKETDNWLQHRGLRPVPASEVRDSADIIRARWLFTRKADGRAKARLVLLGYQTKDLGKEPAASPTASRRARNVMLTIAAAHNWKLIKGDVTSAFLQANEMGKDLFIEPDAVLKKAFMVKEGELLRVVKPGCGIGEAPRHWWETVKVDFKKLGLQPCELEPCMWQVRCPQTRRLIGMVMAHVDVFILAGDTAHPKWTNIVSQIRKLYKWGTWEDMNDSITSLEQCGVTIEENEMGFFLHQRAYVDKITEDQTVLRAFCGEVYWLGVNAIPFLLAWVAELQSKIPEGTRSLFTAANNI
ncbi:unnamed protein product, partial [Prorocentrum cordatum]